MDVILFALLYEMVVIDEFITHIKLLAEIIHEPVICRQPRFETCLAFLIFHGPSVIVVSIYAF